jgi:serine/threonine-protein kinase
VLPPAVGDERPRRPRRWAWWALAVLVAAAAGVATYFLTRPTQVSVPNTVNEPLSAAQTQLQNAGFTPNLLYRSDTHLKDLVIDQSPRGGTMTDKGATVTLTVSTGPGPVNVPSVQGLPERDAKRAITHVGLKVGRVAQQSSDAIPQGSAINTDPPAGTSLPAGQGVTLFVSSGQPPVNVPGVVGTNKADAERTLSGLNITVQTSTQESSTSPPDTVISQSATGKVPAGSTVTLTIATAPTTATVPDVTGKTAAAATTALTQAGFKVSKSTKDVATQVEDGVVISQSPAGNATAAKKSTVKLVVGHYKATTTTTTTGTNTTPTTTTTSTTKTTP